MKYELKPGFNILELRKFNHDDKEIQDLEMFNEQSLRSYGVYQVMYFSFNDEPLSKVDKILLAIGVLFLVTPFILGLGFLIHALW